MNKELQEISEIFRIDKTLFPEIMSDMIFYGGTKERIYLVRILHIDENSYTITYQEVCINTTCVKFYVTISECGTTQLNRSLGIFRPKSIPLYEIPSNTVNDVYNAFRDIIINYALSVDKFIKTLNRSDLVMY